MENSTFDTFISYRRAGGSVIASRIYDNLLLKGFSPFYDITEMRAGRFDEQLKNRIINAENFVLILSKHALDRCQDEQDWVRQEITLAISYHLNIITVQEPGFVFPENLPAELQTLSLYQTVFYDEGDFHAGMDSISKMLLCKRDVFSISGPDIWANKKFNLCGDYITLYEDVEDGKTVVRKAPATLVHRGKRLSGTTAFSKNQSWVIKGTVYKKKRIAGVYYAKDVLDEGFGTFFLEIKSNSALEGFWSGYDNVNHTVTSGRYLFKRKFTDYSVTSLQKRDIPDICEIADKQLGDNYITESLLGEVLNETADMHCICAIDKTTSRVIAFCLYSFLDSQAAQGIAGRDILELRYAEKIGYLKTIAVREEYAGYGIGSKLVSHCLQIMNQQKTDLVISTAWKHAGITNIGNILEHYGFANRREITDYWYEDSVKEGFRCPQCGNPCHCTCVIYIKK